METVLLSGSIAIVDATVLGASGEVELCTALQIGLCLLHILRSALASKSAMDLRLDGDVLLSCLASTASKDVRGASRAAYDCRTWR